MNSGAGNRTYSRQLGMALRASQKSKVKSQKSKVKTDRAKASKSLLVIGLSVHQCPNLVK